jgi:hypothetical protein
MASAARGKEETAFAWLPAWLRPPEPAVKFDALRSSRWDLATFGGRWAHFAELAALENNLRSDADVAAAAALLAAPAGASDADLWRAKTAVASARHPDTGS